MNDEGTGPAEVTSNRAEEACKMNPWALMESGRYQAAIAHYTRAYDLCGGVTNLNRAIAYLQVGDYHRALEDFRMSSAFSGPMWTDGQLLGEGLCLWQLRQPARAVDAWRRACSAPYTDAAGGVVPPAFLLYAGVRLGDHALTKEAVALLRKHARRKLGVWPGPIVPFLLGKLDVSTLDRYASRYGPEDTLGLRERCQADFYVAVRALREGDDALFRQRMTQCATNPKGLLETEYFQARWEVRSGFPKPPFPPIEASD